MLETITEFLDLDDDLAPLVRIPKEENSRRYLIGIWVAKGYLSQSDAERVAYFMGIPLWRQPTTIIHPELLQRMLSFYLSKDTSNHRIPGEAGRIYEFQQQARIISEGFSYEEQDRIKNFLT